MRGIQGPALMAAVVGAALVAVLARVELSTGGLLVPFSLQSLGVVACGLALGARAGALAVTLYLVAGALGAPIFADGASGIGHLGGPTGGYLLGFVGAAWLAGRLRATEANGLTRQLIADTAAGLAGHALIFALGVPWLALSMGLSPSEAAMAGMLPYLASAALKSAAAAALAAALTRLAPGWGAVSREPRGVSGARQTSDDAGGSGGVEAR